MFSIDTYDPLNAPKAIGDDIWIVDGPVIGFQYLGMKLPFPTRMTIIRLASDKLFVHSPIRLTAELKTSVDAHDLCRTQGKPAQGNQSNDRMGTGTGDYRAWPLV